MEPQTIPAAVEMIEPSGKISAGHYNAMRREEIFAAIKVMTDHRRSVTDAGFDLFDQKTTRAFASVCCDVVDAFGRLPFGSEFREDLPRVLRFARLLDTGLSNRYLAVDGWIPGADFLAAVDDVERIPERINSGFEFSSKRVEKFEDLWRLRKNGGLTDRQICKMTGLDELQVRAESDYFDWANSPYKNPDDPNAPKSITLVPNYHYPIELAVREAVVNRPQDWIAGSSLCEISLKLATLTGREMAEPDFDDAEQELEDVA
jgi:hypothetical protein